jgi:hypothetical protein
VRQLSYPLRVTSRQENGGRDGRRLEAIARELFDALNRKDIDAVKKYIAGDAQGVDESRAGGCADATRSTPTWAVS